MRHFGWPPTFRMWFFVTISQSVTYYLNGPLNKTLIWMIWNVFFSFINGVISFQLEEAAPPSDNDFHWTTSTFKLDRQKCPLSSSSLDNKQKLNKWFIFFLSLPPSLSPSLSLHILLLFSFSLSMTPYVPISVSLFLFSIYLFLCLSIFYLVLTIFPYFSLIFIF